MVVAATNYKTGDAKIRTDRTDSVTEAICNRTNPKLFVYACSTVLASIQATLVRCRSVWILLNDGLPCSAIHRQRYC